MFASLPEDSRSTEFLRPRKLEGLAGYWILKTHRHISMTFYDRILAHMLAAVRL